MYSLTYLQLLAFLSWIIKEHLRMLIFLKMCRDHIFFEQTISFPFVISGPVSWCYPGGCCNVFEGAYYQQCNHENYRFWCVSNFLWCSCDQFISHFLSFFFGLMSIWYIKICHQLFEICIGLENLIMYLRLKS